MNQYFNKIAQAYDDNTPLQQAVGDRLIESLEGLKLNAKTILDLGSGTGYGSQLLQTIYKRAKIYQLDSAVMMLKKAQQCRRANYYVQADAHHLPLKTDHFDLVYSNLMLQWCDDLDLVFSEVARVLTGGGLFLFSSLGPDTLYELRDSWQAIDGDEVEHVNHFIDMHDLGDALVRTGYEAPVLNTERITLTYTDSIALMQDLKKIGSHYKHQHYRHSLTGKNKLRMVRENYEKYRKQGRLPATYEVVYAHAWCKPPHEKTISFEAMKQLLKKRLK